LHQGVDPVITGKPSEEQHVPLVELVEIERWMPSRTDRVSPTQLYERHFGEIRKASEVVPRHPSSSCRSFVRVERDTNALPTAIQPRRDHGSLFAEAS
jgi:hypothetical protein